ncbi:hypothetical protein G4177_33060 [Corallococcus sp. ZKHCc1 1396]|uniref:Uncharacterized protein n=1 Tax=Corallococcus soli TaxID=2710757 RepID=A0ABR9PYJ0_9BACT|nr:MULTISPECIES: hypothetical protein [Corallococcus]MBE4752991.1 hypothetical protein [Corallococcus soli]MCY1037130.1 hypothetical protein [Corallococcus sp. BB11-1]RYZ34645.1 MAG: hypothetical protein EOO72_12870 [Myxococcaceae bacterium]
MEWLEFKRWSPEVQHALALQAARLGQTAMHAEPPRQSATMLAAHRLCTLLRQYPRTNPWGHPASEC